MIRLDTLVRNARKLSINTDHGDEHGYDDEYFVVAANMANVELQKALVSEGVQVSAGYYEYEADGTTDAHFALPEDIFSEQQVYEVWYSPTGTASDWQDPLRRGFERRNYGSGWPDSFFVEGSGFYLDLDPPAGGKVRIRYEKQVDALDLARGTVTNVEMQPDPDSDLFQFVDLTSASDELLNELEYVCVVDRHGAVKARNLPVLSYDPSIPRLTFTTDYPDDWSGTVATGDIVVIGRDTSTHSRFPRMATTWFLEFMKTVVYEGQSSQDILVANPRLSAILSALTEVYRMLPGGKLHLPETRGEL